MSYVLGKEINQINLQNSLVCARISVFPFDKQHTKSRSLYKTDPHLKTPSLSAAFLSLTTLSIPSTVLVASNSHGSLQGMCTSVWISLSIFSQAPLSHLVLRHLYWGPNGAELLFTRRHDHRTLVFSR